jgi:hypothetical protein
MKENSQHLKTSYVIILKKETKQQIVLDFDGFDDDDMKKLYVVKSTAQILSIDD